MIGTSETRCSAFEGPRRIASGTLLEVAEPTKAAIDRRGADAVLIFDDATGHQLEVDFRGDWGDVGARILELGATPSADRASLAAKADAVATESGEAESADRATPPRGPGRPRLGVVPREVTLLPRHWEWLGRQPGGASVALRKLVEEARRANEGRDVQRSARDATYSVITVLAGNLFGYEDATRALFAGDRTAFEQFSAAWPADIRDFARRLALAAWTSETAV